jgi:endo-1,3(4)-beta-glucanase
MFCYSYHIYAAAVLARYDEDWAKQNFENVLLLVRDYANPSPDDTAFPVFRHKDFFNGMFRVGLVSFCGSRLI